MTDLELFFDAHTHHFDSGTRAIVQLTADSGREFPPFFSFGIHPQDAASFDPDAIRKQCLELNQHPGFIALGEIGLDHRYNTTHEQEALYIFQLELASELQKPVILHCVNTWDRCRFLHEKHASGTPLIYHGFNKASILDAVLNYSPAVISIGESVRSNPKLQSCIAAIPSDRLLLETDMGSGALTDTYRAVAEIKSVSLRALTEQLNQNAKRIFKL